MNWYWYIAFGIVGLILLILLVKIFEDLRKHYLSYGKPMSPKFNIRREYYTKTKLKHRLKDEQTTEPYALSSKEWSNNIKNLDYPGIDDKLPPGYKIEKSSGYKKHSIFFGERIEYRISLFNKKGERIGFIDFHDNNKKRETDINFGFIEPGYRGKGLYPYLRREVINHVDKKGHALATSTAGDSDFTDENLRKHYLSYGKPNQNGKKYIIYSQESDLIVRRPHE